MPDAVMLFAAGFGTRMGALTADRPKPLIEVAGRTLLDRTLDLVRAVAPARVVVNAHYRAPQIVAHLAGRDVTVSVETPEILDTGGGLRHALPHLGPAPVFTSNTDAVWTGPNPFETLAAAWDPARMEALLLTVPEHRATGRQGPGDFTLGPDGRLTRGGPQVYTGVQILATDRLAAIPDRAFSLNRVWDAIARDGRLYGTEHPGRWADVGHPDGIARAETMLKEA
ncbi:nucleotidyltransferase family protein [Roseivivax isoporae]|uniref:Nucleotidyltransferase n=1 Tax=Roseivivax isoporae LMG 25204 TaxID=1449351 RepID=X7F729_9RHOB|nr:nucleotidyltransferase family protein [Roseivivax isoporae]ETX27911.1 nucleotidyltransferase [Roseivivax isoporae LMG 25204]